MRNREEVMRERTIGSAGFSSGKMAPSAVECHQGRGRTREGGRSPETSLTGPRAQSYMIFFLEGQKDIFDLHNQGKMPILSF